MTIQEYLDKVNTRYKAGISTEHSYRGDLQNLLETIATDVLVTNEPTRIACGAPDYIITKKGIPLGYIEAKDIGKSLDSKDYTEQFDRYRNSLPNLIITDYLDFRLFIEGEFVTSVVLAIIQDGKVIPKPENFETFNGLLKNFCSYSGQTIKSPSKLAKMMAGKARLLANTIEKAINEDESQDENNAYEKANDSLRQQLNAFKQYLLHDIAAKEFADIYAQTIAYGMFAARYHDATLEDFSRQEAAELIPKTNPFLRKLFQYVAGYDLDERIKWIVDELVTIFRAADVAAIMNNFGKSTQQTDPVIHFYETFLSEYDPKLRKARGVWYTPEPVVNFIVRAVDDILKTEFNLPEGLADTSKTKITLKTPTHDKRYSAGLIDYEKEVHKVQILDPACGTGTFLAEITKQIYKKFEGQQGIWSQYVEDHLIPRLNGFELLMASYSMAHLKMDMLLHETGFKPKKEQRFRIYLTNSLEEYHPDTGTLFASWLSDEADEANRVKRDTPVMCVIGNPPYAVSSTNKNEWIEKLINDYKKDLNEKSYNSLSDDYVKFIRYGQHYIEKNGNGILAYISNNSFIDGLVFRQMRKHLLESFDQIYILDLHGNAKKKEVCIDGSADQNVFDIMQGVSINIFVKTGRKKKGELGIINHTDLKGSREFKYKFLNENSIKAIEWNNLLFDKFNYFFVKKDFVEIDTYSKGFKIDDLFNILGPGVETGLDRIFISDSKKDLKHTFENISIKSDDVFKLLNIENKSSFQVKDKLKNENFTNIADGIVTFQYKVFDFKHLAYFKNSLRRADFNVFKNVSPNNVFLTLMRASVDTDSFKSILVSKFIIDKNLYSFQTYAIPLYIFYENKGQQTIEQTAERTPNLNLEIVNQIASKLGLTFTPEKNASSTPNTASEPVELAPIDILDYIYAVLHSPLYREKYKEFLKIDFPRVPFPENKETFWQLVKLGGELRQLHLLESPTVLKYITQYPIDGTNEVCNPKYIPIPKNETSGQLQGNVFINDTQYFADVPLIAWSFYIGGYQPAQKWLKDRKGRVLSFEDILHYQKVIVALAETDRLMKEIDTIALFDK